MRGLGAVRLQQTWYGLFMRWTICISVLVALTGCKEEIYFIPGTGTLPDCNEAPAADLSGTVWFNQGTVTILTAGCADEQPETMLTSCAENWAMTQNGNEVDIVVDEYRVNGRFCGDKLYLEGGWWLSVTNEQGNCLYGDDDGDEFGIQAEGNVLTYTYTAETPETRAQAELTGVLLLRGRCDASYDATFQPIRPPPPPG